MVYTMQVTHPSIKKLLEKYKEISLIGKISATINWDLNVNLPPKGGAYRAEQSAYIMGLMTSKWLDPEFRNLVEKTNTEKNLTPDEKAIVRNINYGAKYFYKIPKEIIIEKEEVTSAAFIVWRQAREENNFKIFLPHLTKILELDRKIATYLGYKDNPYDALLDLYEPELTAKECQRLFGGVKKELVPFIKKITKRKDAASAFLSENSYYPVADQEKILKFAVEKMGFDFSRGAINISAHPFTTTLGPNDVRLTTFYNSKDFRESFTSSTHEAGHGLYELGINPAYEETPLDGGVSLGIHESLSRFWENMVGKHPGFLMYMAPLFKAIYREQLKGIDEIEIVKSFHHVTPSLIRIHADEVTYALHIILRFEMENALVNGKLSVKDADEAWREKSKVLFGIAPKTDSEGILQDVHWTYGNFGYFPSYLLGNLYGAQFLYAMKKDIAFDEEITKGNLLPVKNWLDIHIHTYGSYYFPADLVKKVTGKPLDSSYFLKYIIQKYSAIYKL